MPNWTHHEVETGSGYGKYMTTGIYYKGRMALEVADCFPKKLAESCGGEDEFVRMLVLLLNKEFE